MPPEDNDDEERKLLGTSVPSPGFRAGTTQPLCAARAALRQRENGQPWSAAWRTALSSPARTITANTVSRISRRASRNIGPTKSSMMPDGDECRSSACLSSMVVRSLLPGAAPGGFGHNAGGERFPPRRRRRPQRSSPQRCLQLARRRAHQATISIRATYKPSRSPARERTLLRA